jgi:hypothetical protein
VEFSPIRLIAVVIGIVLLLLIGNMVLSRFRGATADPNTPPSVPETSAFRPGTDRVCAVGEGFPGLSGTHGLTVATMLSAGVNVS